MGGCRCSLRKVRTGEQVPFDDAKFFTHCFPSTLVPVFIYTKLVRNFVPVVCYLQRLSVHRPTIHHDVLLE